LVGFEAAVTGQIIRVKPEILSHRQVLVEVIQTVVKILLSIR
jgi:hypothetical protein